MTAETTNAQNPMQTRLPAKALRRPGNRPRPLLTVLAAAVLALSQAACGGGGGDSTSPAGGNNSTGTDGGQDSGGQGGTGGNGGTDNGGTDTGGASNGGGNGGSGTGTDGGTTTPADPLVLSTASVADGGTGASRSAPITLSFDAAVAPASVTASSILLTRGGNPVALEASASGADVTITPLSRLWPLTSYALRATTALSNAAGGHLAADITRSFTTADGSWDALTSAPQGDAPTGTAASPLFAFDGAGNAVAAWIVGSQIRSARMDAATGVWTADPTVLSPSTDGQVASLALAVSPKGDAIVVWTAHDTTGEEFDVDTEVHLRARRLVNGNWLPAEWVDRLSDQVNSMNAGGYNPPRVAFNDQGQAAILYYAQSKATLHHGIWGSVFDGSVWSSRRVDTVAGDAEDHQPAVWSDAGGRLIGAWTSGVLGAGQIQAALLDPATFGSTAPTPASRPITLIGGAGAEPQLRVGADTTGAATIVVLNGSDLSFVRLATDQTFSTGLVAIATLSDAVRAFDASRSSTGDTLVAVNLAGAAEAISVWRVPAASNTVEGPVDAATGGGYNLPKIAYDPAGNALLTYNETDAGRYGIRYSRWIAGADWASSTWSAPAWLSRTPADGADVFGDNSRLMFDATGSAMQLWTDAISGGGRLVQAKRFQ